MCTRIVWDQRENIGAVASGRVMDFPNWHEGWKNGKVGVDMWVLPAGMTRAIKDGTAVAADPASLMRAPDPHQPAPDAKELPPASGPRQVAQWTSALGSVVVADKWDSGRGGWVAMSADGVNESLLVGHAMTMSKAVYPQPDARPALSGAMWLQYYLDNFRSVREALAVDLEERLRLEDFRALGSPMKLHLTLEDSAGDWAVIEFAGDSASHHVHDSRQYPVVTNFLTCRESEDLLRRYPDDPPGGDDWHSRFVRASYHYRQLPKPDTAREMLAYLLSILRNVSQPFGRQSDNRAGGSGSVDRSQAQTSGSGSTGRARPDNVVRPTWWRTVAFLHKDNPRYFFESTVGPNSIWVDIKRLVEQGRFAAGQPARRLGLTREEDELDRVGDVTDLFVEEKTPFAWPV
jgi:choloylglycine hydrolase